MTTPSFLVILVCLAIMPDPNGLMGALSGWWTLDSLNGTYYQKARLKQSEVKPGDQSRLGTTVGDRTAGKMRGEVCGPRRSLCGTVDPGLPTWSFCWGCIVSSQSDGAGSGGGSQGGFVEVDSRQTHPHGDCPQARRFCWEIRKTALSPSAVRFTIGSGKTLGRLDDNDIIILDPFASRAPCRDFRAIVILCLSGILAA